MRCSAAATNQSSENSVGTDEESQLSIDFRSSTITTISQNEDCSNSYGEIWCSVPKDSSCPEPEHLQNIIDLPKNVDQLIIDTKYQNITCTNSIFSETTENVFDREYKNALRERQVSWNAKTSSLRQSVIVTLILFISYIILGVIFYSYAAEWKVRDTLYFIIYTVTTIGYGNINVPATPLSRAFTTIYLLVGTLLMSVVVSEIFQYIHLEALKAQFSRDNSFIAKKGMKNVIPSRHLSKETIFRNLKKSVTQDTNKEKVLDWTISKFLYIKKFFGTHDIGKYLSVFLPHTLLVVILATVVGIIEEWSVIDSIYFSVVTISTVGYGDIVPTKNASIWFCTVYMPLSLLWIPLLFTNASKAFFSLHSWNIDRIKRKDLLEDDVSETKELEDKGDSMMNISMNGVLDSLAVFGVAQPNQPEIDDIPSLILRISIIKRMAYIVTKDVVGGSYDLNIKGNSLTVTFSGLKEVTDKWMIPRRAKNAFREISFKVMLYTGSKDLSAKGTKYLFSLSFKELHEIFSPLLVAMGTTSTMETWLTSTELLTREWSIKDDSNIDVSTCT